MSNYTSGSGSSEYPVWNFIDNILARFRKCFSREAAFSWFLIVVAAFIVRTDKLGVTSFIRSLSLSGSKYECLIHFFRSSAWNLNSLRICWYGIVLNTAPLYLLDERPVLVCDGVKCSKEGRYMVGVKKHAQESQTQSKPEMIHGHLWGNVSVLIGDLEKLACLPLSTRIHDGIQVMADWSGTDVSSDSHVVQIMKNACEAASVFGRNVYLLADRYFLSVPALQALNAFFEKTDIRVDLITKAKKNITAYEVPAKETGKRRGRRRVKGKKVKLQSYFKTRSRQFRKAKVFMYGEYRDVKYYKIDLLWGQKYYQKLRFVLVKYIDKKDNSEICGILATTDLSLDPLKIIGAYSRRFRCEHLYRELKQVLSAFNYHFWTKSMPKLNHFRKKSDPDPMKSVTDEDARTKIINALRATEMYMFASNVAMGLIMIISIKFDFDPSQLRYQRTPAKKKPSEANVSLCLRKQLFQVLVNRDPIRIVDLIRERSRDFLYPEH